MPDSQIQDGHVLYLKEFARLWKKPAKQQNLKKVPPPACNTSQTTGLPAVESTSVHFGWH